VKEGREDFTIDAGEPDMPLAQLAVEVPAQLHIFDFPSILYAVLDRGSAPFKDERARKALNLAIDRKAVAEAMGAPLAASETCQVLPKNLSGYQPICPYTLAPNASGLWTAPDLATAKRLVAQSKTAGTHVTIWLEPFDKAERVKVAQLMAKAMRSIGYVVDVKNFDGDLIGELLSGNTKHLQVRIEGWGIDYPGPASFFVPLLTCKATIERLLGPDTSFNLAGFCSPEIDRKMERALELQRTDAKAAGDLWAEIDRAVVEQAPWVPLGTLRTPVLVSPRIGNVLLSTALGPLMTQMWIHEEAGPSP
jgi:peptide/nickel transport system substrate-binding protein